MTDDVLPWEQMKLRMLNGSHSFLAWLGYLAGHAHISDCMQDPIFRSAAYRLMLDEQAPTLSIQGVDLTAYADSLIARFSNPALKHRTWQIAMDGSQKLPQRMLDGIRVHLARGSRWPLLALGVAGWMRYVSGIDDAGNAIDIRDPLADKMQKRVSPAMNTSAWRPCFAGRDLRPRPAAEPAVCRSYHRRMASARRFWRASGDCRHAERLTISAFSGQIPFCPR
jgi:mannitol-1-phosphate/altronate dehydrogenase